MLPKIKLRDKLCDFFIFYFIIEARNSYMKKKNKKLG